MKASGAYKVTHSYEANVNLGSPIPRKRHLDEEFAQYKTRRRGACGAKSELDTYLDEDTEEDSEGFDVLAWWKSHNDKFPVLSTTTRDFLAIHLSTMASESAFSCGGRILGDTRSSLTPELLEALVCTKDWLFKAKRCGY